jgi:hypothetical protein
MVIRLGHGLLAIGALFAARAAFAQDPSERLNVSVGAYWNVLRPETAASPRATAEVQVALLLPR